MVWTWSCRWVLRVAAGAAVAGCYSEATQNPAMPVTLDEAKDALQAMAKTPKPLERPVVVIGGWPDPGVGPYLAKERLAKLFERGDDGADERVVWVEIGDTRTVDEARAKVLEAVERRWPSDAGAGETVEVDVVGQSMGGVIAAYAGKRDDGAGDVAIKRLNVRRLFAIASPFRGANAAEDVRAWTPIHRDLRPGSAFLTALNEGEWPFEVTAYTRAHDRFVGAKRTAPAGQESIWVPDQPLEASHLGAMTDERILADIARRLRGEEPLSRSTAREAR